MALMGKILIFDDDPDILELCKVILKVKGFETHGCTTTRNLAKKVREFNPDVILMDNWIPEMGGVEATLEIKNTDDIKHIPVIFFSASNEVNEYANKAKADFVIQKPFDIADLHNTVVSALKKNSQKADA
jgi:two-component system, OmpR family, alkaline phosphatase synthesis response regulator PhoP